MNTLIILLVVIITGGFLGIVACFGLFMSRDKIGGCEECGKGCEVNNYYFYGSDYEVEISDTEDGGESENNNNASDIPDKHEGTE